MIDLVPAAMQDSLPFSAKYPEGTFFFQDNPWFGETNEATGRSNLDTVLDAFDACRVPASEAETTGGGLSPPPFQNGESSPSGPIGMTIETAALFCQFCR